MEKIEAPVMVDVFDGDETNMGLKLLDFLKKAELPNKSNNIVTTNLGIIKGPFRVHKLLKDNEYIRTRANEVPLENGGWCYNGNNIYGFYYILLEGNSLLIIEESTSINDFADAPYCIRFSLYPNADQFVIKTPNGHNEGQSYINIVNHNGELISRFYFEVPYQNPEGLNGLPLNAVISPISIDYLANIASIKGR